MNYYSHLQQLRGTGSSESSGSTFAATCRAARIYVFEFFRVESESHRALSRTISSKVLDHKNFIRTSLERLTLIIAPNRPSGYSGKCFQHATKGSVPNILSALCADLRDSRKTEYSCFDVSADWASIRAQYETKIP